MRSSRRSEKTHGYVRRAIFCANTGSVLPAACGGMCSNVSWRSFLHSEQGPNGLDRLVRGMSITVTGAFDRAARGAQAWAP